MYGRVSGRKCDISRLKSSSIPPVAAPATGPDPLREAAARAPSGDPTSNWRAATNKPEERPRAARPTRPRPPSCPPSPCPTSPHTPAPSTRSPSYHSMGGRRRDGSVVRLLRRPDADPNPSGPTRRLLRGRLATGPAQPCSRSTNTYATARDLARARRRGGGGGAEIAQTARGGRAPRRGTRVSTTSGEGPADVKSRSSPRVRVTLGTW